MTQPVYVQILVFLAFWAYVMVQCLVYDVVLVLTNRLSRRYVILTDVVYGVVLIVSTITFNNAINYGIFRWYYLLSALLAIYIYYTFCHVPLDNWLFTIYNGYIVRRKDNNDQNIK